MEKLQDRSMTVKIISILEGLYRKNITPTVGMGARRFDGFM
jgi:hypothetical protein